MKLLTNERKRKVKEIFQLKSYHDLPSMFMENETAALKYLRTTTQKGKSNTLTGIQWVNRKQDFLNSYLPLRRAVLPSLSSNKVDSSLYLNLILMREVELRLNLRIKLKENYREIERFYIGITSLSSFLDQTKGLDSKSLPRITWNSDPLLVVLPVGETNSSKSLNLTSLVNWAYLKANCPKYFDEEVMMNLLREIVTEVNSWMKSENFLKTTWVKSENLLKATATPVTNHHIIQLDGKVLNLALVMLTKDFKDNLTYLRKGNLDNLLNLSRSLKGTLVSCIILLILVLLTLIKERWT